MHVQSYHSYVEDSTLKLPFSVIAPRLIQSLDRFLGYVETHHADILDQLAQGVRKLTNLETPIDLPSRDESVFEMLIAECAYASRYPMLFKAHYDLLRSLVGIEQSQWIAEELVELSQVQFIRVRYLPNYLKLKALVALLNRDQAIDFMKAYLDWAVAEGPMQPNAPESLTELRERQLQFNLQEAGMDWVSAVMSEHQYLNKVTVCRIQKVLSDYGDSDLMDVVACYPDSAMFRKTNESFRLTRTQTLMNGGCCCDTCYHDVRFVQDFEHPPLDVFASLPESSD